MLVVLAQVAVVGGALAFGGAVGAAPDDADLADAPRPAAAQRGTLYLNFTGATVTHTEWFDEDDARDNTSWLFGGTFEAYDDDASARAIEQAVRRAWSPYDLEIVVERPTHGDYVMAIVTPTNPVGGGIVGYAPVDCWDTTSASNIIFAFHAPTDAYATTARATTVSQEVAHSFGLEHVDAPADIMNPIVGATEAPSFTDGCRPIVGSSFCGPQHGELCGADTMQNSHRELLAILGPAQPDTAPPSGVVVEPPDGSMLAMGSELRVVVQATDDNAVDSVMLYDGGQLVGVERVAPYGWTLPSPERGTHELYALVIDHAGHESLTEVSLVGVGELPADSPTPNLPGQPGGPPLSRGEDSSGCRVVPIRGRSGWWMLGLGLALVSRRRVRTIA